MRRQRSRGSVGSSSVLSEVSSSGGFGKGEDSLSDLAATAYNSEYGDFGDLSDCPAHWRQEVIGVIRRMRSLWKLGNPGAISELREWINAMQRLSGFSRQVCLNLTMAMSRCLAADRKGKLPSAADVQGAFVRMGGVKHACEMMMLRLDDEIIVGHVVRVLAAAVQNSPLAAEAFQRDGLNNLKLVLRSIERHKTCEEVAEAGCLLMGHLCSITASDRGPLNPVRTKAHRDCQDVLTREGAIELAVEIISIYIKDVKDLANKATLLMQEKLAEVEKQQRQNEMRGDEVFMAPKIKKTVGKLGLKDRIMKVQANIELRQAWQKVIDKEAPAGRVQEAAVQALILMSVGNLNTTRQLGGCLWVQHTNLVLDLGESFIGAAKDKAEAAKSRTRLSSDSDDDSQDGLGGGTRQRGKVKKVELPQGEARRSMTSLESLAFKCHLCVDVLRGRACKDRPSLAVKACRLTLLVLEHHKSLLVKANNSGAHQCREVAVRIRGAPGSLYKVPEEDRTVEAPFNALHGLMAALMVVVRTHIENATVLTAVMATIAELRVTAMLSTPAGMEANGAAAEKAWQALLTSAGGQDVEVLMRAASKKFVSALHDTEKGDFRMKTMGLAPTELEGNGEWLTPRARKETGKMQKVIEVLSADALRGTWGKKGEPGRWENVLERKAMLAEQAAEREELRLAKENDMTVEEWRAHLELQKPPEPSEHSDLDSDLGGIGEADEDEDKPDFTEEDFNVDNFYTRAVGFGAHDQEDFDRMWRKPITEAILRCLPGQADPNSVWAQKAADAKAKVREEAAALGIPVEDSLDELLVVEMLESVQGKLVVRATVQPQDRIQQNVIDMRAGDLMKPVNTAKSITCELSKGLKKNGYLLPKYGIHVKMKKAVSTSKLPTIGRM
eukprot:TRINITY_DN16840_c0_g1_i2.p1 TRINITY_DN16840_c0_g1~~TRINITY_DN16840_c0_g1_i2.p1  ORF type:complete len:896 (+),score=237.28 TRINITY_DN16840_c0_g1_i2:90-2777(+)